MYVEFEKIKYRFLQRFSNFTGEPSHFLFSVSVSVSVRVDVLSCLKVCMVVLMLKKKNIYIYITNH